MTILDCIVSILNESAQGLTANEIYNQIIERGMYSFRAANPQNVVNSYLRRRCADLDFPSSYREKLFYITDYEGKSAKYALLNESITSAPDQTISKKEGLDRLPEEKIQVAVKKHISAIKSEILEKIVSNSPTFFERLVIDLLLKMGYGYDNDSGFVTGKSRDGGIEGIIFEDNLGLDRIYIQAKRYSSENKVKRPELQAFIGAMEDAQKGVFITTSQFTSDAILYANKQQQKHIKLIDGDLLSELLVNYEVGLTTAQVLKIYRIDTDYYGE